MHYANVKSILSSNNGINMYRGCSHGCIYCDSRSNIYNMGHDFEDIEVKQNGLELLKKALKNKKEKVMVGTGSMSDPYIPLEKEVGYTRKTLKLIYRYGHGFTCITKSNLVLRDLDLLKKINTKTKAVVQMTLTCSDDELSKIIEPNVCTTTERVDVLKRLQREKIPTIVWICPILPYITDSEENVNQIIDYCIETDVKGIVCFEMGMTLREGNREYFYKNLDKHFPGMKKVYQTRYGKQYAISSPNNSKLMLLFKKRTSEFSIMSNPNEIFDYLHEFPSKDETKQTTLFNKKFNIL